MTDQWYNIIRGDCIEAMRLMPADSIDSIVCDPPYGIDFMGKSWDKPGEMVGTALGISGGFQKFPPGVKRPEYKRSDPHIFQLWCEAWAAEALRVLKPGGHLLAFGGTRMYHRLASGIEDAGFEIRDCIMWTYGSGFPKSHNVALSIDKMNGHGNRGRAIPTASSYQASDRAEENKLTSNPVEAYSARSHDAEAWDGWGTALKPAVEPVVVARKPLVGTVASNVLEHGTGALNIDACRIGSSGGGTKCNNRDEHGKCLGHDNAGRSTSGETVHGPESSAGRWPANIIFDEDAADALDESVQDNVSRFFYVVKPNKKEKNAGLDKRSSHPTVKPIQLMRYLVRLVTQPHGIVLDPFTGSGTTGIAAMLEGFSFVGCEMGDEYADIAEARMKHWTGFAEDDTIEEHTSGVHDSGTESLF